MQKKSSKNPVGRPPVLGKARAIYMHLRISQDEKDSWEAWAAKEDKPLSQAVRDLVNQAAKR